MRPAESQLSVTITRVGDDTVLALAGELDLYTAAAFRERAVDLVHDARLRLVVDMAALHFVDSTGLGALVAELNRVRTGGGDMVLRNPNPAVRHSIQIVGLERALPIRD